MRLNIGLFEQPWKNFIESMPRSTFMLGHIDISPSGLHNTYVPTYLAFCIFFAKERQVIFFF